MLSHQLVEADFEYKKMAPLKVKGKQEPVQVFEIQKEIAAAGADEKFVPFDREEEIEILKQRIHSVIDSACPDATRLGVTQRRWTDQHSHGGGGAGNRQVMDAVRVPTAV